MNLRQFIYHSLPTLPFFTRGLTKSRLSLSSLRLRFTLFFFALAIPSAIISFTAYEKLHLENIYQYQQAARAIALDLNSTLNQAIAKEEAQMLAAEDAALGRYSSRLFHRGTHNPVAHQP